MEKIETVYWKNNIEIFVSVIYNNFTIFELNVERLKFCKFDLVFNKNNNFTISRWTFNTSLF